MTRSGRGRTCGRFYLGTIGVGILKLTTSGGRGPWTQRDLIAVRTWNTRDKQGGALAGSDAHKAVACIVTIVFFVTGGTTGTIQGLVAATTGSGGSVGS